MIESPGQATDALLTEHGYLVRTYDRDRRELSGTHWPAVNVFYVPSG